MTIEKASAAVQAEILVLYRSLIGQPGCTWCKEYPDEEIAAEDLHSGSLYCARENGSIVGAAFIEWRDEEVERFDCWSKENEPAAYLSRVEVSAYRALAFDFSGEADAFGQHWLCYEKRL